MNQTRRTLMQGALASASLFALGAPADAARSKPSSKHASKPPAKSSAKLSFPDWVEGFRKRAHARGISDKTYDSVMNGLKPDTAVYALQSAQPEFKEETWQYINRRANDWRLINGKEILKQHGALLEKIEREIGVDRYILLALWGVESA